MDDILNEYEDIPPLEDNPPRRPGDSFRPGHRPLPNGVYRAKLIRTLEEHRHKYGHTLVVFFEVIKPMEFFGCTVNAFLSKGQTLNSRLAQLYRAFLGRKPEENEVLYLKDFVGQDLLISVQTHGSCGNKINAFLPLDFHD